MLVDNRSRLPQRAPQPGERLNDPTRHLPEDLAEEGNGVQESAKRIFDTLAFEKEYGICKIRKKMEAVSSFHRENYGSDVYQIRGNRVSLPVVQQLSLLAGLHTTSNTHLVLTTLLMQHKESIENSAKEIREQENQLLSIVNLDPTAVENQQSALDQLLDMSYDVSSVNTVKKIRQKQLSLFDGMYKLQIGFLNREEEALKKYKIALKTIFEKHNLSGEQDSKEKAILQSMIRKTQTRISDSLKKIKSKKQKAEEEYKKFEENNKTKSSAILYQFWDCLSVYWKYSKDPAATLNLMIKVLDEVRDYILRHPSKQARAMINNIFLAHKLLVGDDPNLELFARQTEKTLLVDVLTKGFAQPGEELPDDHEMPEKFQRFGKVLRLLPKMIALSEGMKAGSFMPLISFSLFAEMIGFSYAWVFPLANIALGAYENLNHVAYIQDVHEILDEEQRTKLISFLKFLDQKFATIEDLREQQILMSTFREGINAEEKGEITTHVFKRIMHNLNNFYLKLRESNKIERTVRLIGQVGVRAVILNASIVAVIAAFVSLTPGGIMLVSAIYAAIATLGGGSYAAYHVGHTLSRWIDEWYVATVKKVNNMCYAEETQQKVKDFLHENREILKDLIEKAYKHLEEKLDSGRLDLFLNSNEFNNEFSKELASVDQEEAKDLEWRRQQYFEREKQNIKTRLEAAAFIKTYNLSKQEISVIKEQIFGLKESWEVITSLLSKEEPVLSDRELQGMAANQELDLSDRRLIAIKEIKASPNLWDRIMRSIN